MMWDGFRKDIMKSSKPLQRESHHFFFERVCYLTEITISKLRRRAEGEQRAHWRWVEWLQDFIETKGLRFFSGKAFSHVVSNATQTLGFEMPSIQIWSTCSWHWKKVVPAKMIKNAAAGETCFFSLRFRWRVFWLIHLILCSTGGLAQTQVDFGRWPRAAAPSFAMWTVWSHFCWLSCILPW